MSHFTETHAARSSDQVVVARNPVTGEMRAQFDVASADEVARALRAARASQPSWAGRSVRERARVLRRFHAILFARRRQVAEAIAYETGKAVVEATAAELAVVLDFARFYAKHAKRELRPRSVGSATLAHIRKRIRIERQPYGVVAVISPWNYPLMLAAGHILPALVAGNAVLFKPSELTTATGALLVGLLNEAGVPEGVLHLLPGAGETGAALTAAGCDKVFFTGSERTGRAIALACAERLVPCVLELGGSDPAILLDDAPIDAAAAAISWGRFSNAGQTCVAPKRVFVVDSAYEPFLAALRRELETLHVGPTHQGAEVGPPITDAQHAVLTAQLEDALARGARVVARVEVPAEVPEGAVAYFPPTVLTDVPPGARVLTEETFGPILPVVRVRDGDDAVRQANDSPFGLSASVWGADKRRAHAVAERLEVGTVVINDVLVAAGMAEVPHGGMKSSGTGRAHGFAGLDECVRSRTIIEDRFPGLPQPWWFRYGDSLSRGLDDYLRLEHGVTLRERAAGLLGVRRLLPLLWRRDRAGRTHE